MELNIPIMIETIKAKHKTQNTKHKTQRFIDFIFVFSLAFTLLYKFVFLRWEACCMEMYYLGDYLNAIFTSIVTGYVFYFITVIYSEFKHRKSIKPWIDIQVTTLCMQLNNLVSLLLLKDNWYSEEDLVIKEHFNKISTTRCIKTEQSNWAYQSVDSQLIWHPYSLFIIHDILVQIKTTVGNMSHYIEYFDLSLLQHINNFEKSYVYQRVVFFSRQVFIDSCFSCEKDGIDCASCKKSLIDSFFREELPVSMFNPDKNNIVFMKQVRKILDENNFSKT